MKRVPNSKTNLDKAIQRFAGEIRRANELRTLMANAIVAQMIGEGVVKGGSGLRFRYGDKRTRATLDLDTAWRSDLDAFLRTLRGRLEEGWCGFSGELHILRHAIIRHAEKGVPMAAKVEEAYSERTEKMNAAGEMVEVNLDGDRPRETPVFQAVGG